MLRGLGSVRRMAAKLRPHVRLPRYGFKHGRPHASSLRPAASAAC